MCECLTYDTGDRYLCECCAGMVVEAFRDVVRVARRAVADPTRIRLYADLAAIQSAAATGRALFGDEVSARETRPDLADPTF